MLKTAHMAPETHESGAKTETDGAFDVIANV